MFNHKKKLAPRECQQVENKAAPASVRLETAALCCKEDLTRYARQHKKQFPAVPTLAQLCFQINS